MITYERQNKWMTDYLLPLVTGEWSRIPENYRHNKKVAREAERDALRADMQKAGVFESLAKLERQGPECDKPFREFADAINSCDFKYGNFRLGGEFNKNYFSLGRIFGGESGGPGTGYCEYNQNYFDITKREELLKTVQEAWKVSEERKHLPPKGGPAAAA